MRQNKKLEYIYEDLLAKTEMALDELDADRQSTAEDPNEVTGKTPKEELNRIIQQINEVREDSEREQRYGPRPNLSATPNSSKRQGPKVDFESPFSRSGSGEYDPVQDVAGRGASDPFDPARNEAWKNMERQAENSDVFDPTRNDRHHAMQDGADESFEEMKEKVQSFTATDLDPDRLRELADVAEKFDKEPIDPQDMSDDEFQKLLSRLRPELVDWATGEKEMKSENVDQQRDEVLRQIRKAVGNASNIAGNNATTEAFDYLQKEIGNILEENVIEPDER